MRKLWNYCNVVRDDGMTYGDGVKQLTYLLFLEKDDERSRAPYYQRSPIPAADACPALLARGGDDPFDHYRHRLEALVNEKGAVALIFGKARSRFDSRRRRAMHIRRAPFGRPTAADGCQDPAKPLYAIDASAALGTCSG